MRNSSHGRLACQVVSIRREMADAQGLPFADLLCAQRVEQVIEEEGSVIRACVWSPLVTVYTFLAQVLSTDHSCRQAVARLLGSLVTQGSKLCSPTTGPYCKARARLSDTVSRPVFQSQIAPFDRPRGGHGQVVNELHLARVFVCCQIVLDELLDIPGEFR